MRQKVHFRPRIRFGQALDMIWGLKILILRRKISERLQAQRGGSNASILQPLNSPPFLRGREDFNSHFKIFSIHFIFSLTMLHILKYYVLRKDALARGLNAQDLRLLTRGWGDTGTRGGYITFPQSPPLRVSLKGDHAPCGQGSPRPNTKR